MRRTKAGSQSQIALDLPARPSIPAASRPLETVLDAAALRAWLVAWLAELPGTLLRRATVLVPGADLAHSLRCHIGVERGRPGLLLGVSITRPEVLAADILARADRPVRGGLESIRWLELRDLFAHGALAGRLRYFLAPELSAGQGYVDAFAWTIGELESAGLDPPDLERAAEGLRSGGRPLDADRLSDVAAVWQALSAGGGGDRRLSRSLLLREAARVLMARPELGRPAGPTAALLLAPPSTALRRFLVALPAVRLVHVDARPRRPRGERRLGDCVPAPPPEHRIEPPAGELAALGSRLFIVGGDGVGGDGVGSDGVGGDGVGSDGGAPARQPSPQDTADPDHRVERALFAGVAEEVDAAASWVLAEIARGTPVGSIAVLVPDIDAYAPLLRDRLTRLVLPAGATPPAVRIPEGLPVALTPAGLRLKALLAALETHLEVESTLPVLAWLRSTAASADDGDDAQQTASRAPSPSVLAELVHGSGIVGGREASGDEWARRLRQRRASAAADLAAGRTGADREVELLDRLLPAVAALEALTAPARSQSALPVLWRAVRDFAVEWLRLPPDPPNLAAILDGELAPILEHPVAGTLSGVAALRYLASRLHALRFPLGTTGAPAVFVATPARAAGLMFPAVRVLGITEGVVPRSPQDDPILPDALRVDLERRGRESGADDVIVPRLEDRVLDDLHAFDRVVRAATGRLSLSAPRQWVDRSEREVSGVMLEVEIALDREHRVPTLAGIRAALLDRAAAARDAERSGAAAAVFPPAAFAAVHALLSAPSPGATPSVRLPAGWIGAPGGATDLMRLLALDAALSSGDSLGPADGLLGDLLPAALLPGLTAERSISPTGLGRLLTCPYWFLEERILGRRERPRRPSMDMIDPLAFGTLLHSIAEIFFTEHGAAFCRKEGVLEEWRRRVRRLAEREFTRFLDRYPLRGRDAIAREQERVLDTAEKFVGHEWGLAGREYRAAELVFGVDAPVAIERPAGPLYVTGKIDRVDRLDTGGLEVRDLKTGRARDRGEYDLDPAIDLQIGVYALALEAAGASAGEKVHAAAYVYPADMPRDPERRFEGEELARLRGNTHAWLDMARGLLAAGAFLRTPLADDCKFCPYQPSCGDRARDRAAAKLARAGAGVPAALVAFRDFKGAAVEEEAAE